MKQEEKDLLLKDLSCRLPYGVKVQTTYINPQTKERKDIGTDVLSTVEISMLIDGYEEHKPYLFPLSSMTEKQKQEFYKFFEEGITESANETRQWLKTKRVDETRRPITIAYVMVHELVIDWCNKNHFDYRGLIEKGLANDCTNLNIY